jgi:hypothetical protein
MMPMSSPGWFDDRPQYASQHANLFRTCNDGGRKT